MLEQNYLSYPQAVKEAMGLKVDYPAGSSETVDIIIKGQKSFTWTYGGQTYSEDYNPYVLVSSKRLVDGAVYIVKVEERMEYNVDPGHDNGDGSFTLGSNEVAYLKPGLYQCVCEERLNSLNYYLVSPKMILHDLHILPFPNDLEIWLAPEECHEDVCFPAVANIQLCSGSDSGFMPAPGDGGGGIIIKDPGQDDGNPDKWVNP